MTNAQYAHLALRVGVAFAFLYPPFSALSDPISWLGYFPPFVLDAFAGNEQLLLHAFGVLEAVIALWILSGWNIKIPAALATLMLLAIVAFNLPELPILFRDISIALMSLALFFWPSWKQNEPVAPAA